MHRTLTRLLLARLFQRGDAGGAQRATAGAGRERRRDLATEGQYEYRDRDTLHGAHRKRLVQSRRVPMCCVRWARCVSESSGEQSLFAAQRESRIQDDGHTFARLSSRSLRTTVGPRAAPPGPDGLPAVFATHRPSSGWLHTGAAGRTLRRRWLRL